MCKRGLREECLGTSSSGEVFWLGILQGLLHSKLAAGALQDVLDGAGVYKLESETKSVPLLDKREHLDLPHGKAKLEPHDLAQSHLLAQDSGNSRLADIDRMAAHYL